MKATYVSTWDGGEQIRTSCDFNPETKEATNVRTVDVDEIDLEICLEEFIELPNGEIIKSFIVDGVEYIDGEMVE